MRTSLMILLAVFSLPGLAHAQSTLKAASPPQFIKSNENALLSSRLIGVNVQNFTGEGIGKVEDLAPEGDQLVGIVLSVGQISGSDRHSIAIDLSSISIKYTEGENNWKATLNAKIDQLKTAPEFR